MATQVFETTFKSGKVNYKFNIGLHALPASIKGVDTLLFVACIIVNMGNPLFKNAILGKSKKFILFDKHEGIYRLFDTSDSIEPAVVGVLVETVVLSMVVLVLVALFTSVTVVVGVVVVLVVVAVDVPVVVVAVVVVPRVVVDPVVPRFL
jgi:hypothetical protein